MERLALLSGCVVMAAGIVQAVPHVEQDEVRVDNVQGMLSVRYTLRGDPAIVTFSVETNAEGGAWIPLGGELLKSVTGPANCLVRTPGPQHIVWRAYRDWPDVKLPAERLRVSLRAWATNAPPPWMAVDLGAPYAVKYYAEESALPFPVTNRVWKTDSLLLRRIPAAFVEWHMGVAARENGSRQSGWEWTPETGHRVTLTRDYYMAVYQLTQRQYVKITGNPNPSHFTEPCATCGDDEAAVETRPLENITYANAVTSSAGPIERLRALTGIASFNLPTSAEWEYACRAGSSHALYSDKELESDGKPTTSANVSELAWYGSDQNRADLGNAHAHTHPVGLKLPNKWKLYDMLGNVEERTRDWFVSDLGSEPVIDPEQATKAAHDGHATYGGNYTRQAYRVRCCCRNYYDTATPICGIRVMCY